MAERARDTARFAGRGVALAAITAAAIVAAPVIGLALLLGPALGALAALDPALIGALVSKAEPDKADWFILHRWYH